MRNWTLPRSETPPNWRRFLPSEAAVQSTTRSLNKTGDILWIVSHCKTESRREDFVARLRRSLVGVSVDIYGKCGSRRARSGHTADMFRSYRFYLALENALCKDYFTEKVFKVLKYDIVPIVRGAKIRYFGPKSKVSGFIFCSCFEIVFSFLSREYEMALPPHSVIFAESFPDVPALARHIEYLTANETAYAEYFWWKRHYAPVILGAMGKSKTAGLPERFNPFCNFCKMLNGVTEDVMPVDSSPRYANFLRFWTNQAGCR